ncbi:hypothetical protein Taro_042963, partial [Colocasia esculenta]|nr:hypothetical protein [Colocasia esculenta]
MAPRPGPSAPTKNPNVGIAAHKSGDPEGLTDRSNKISGAAAATGTDPGAAAGAALAGVDGTRLRCLLLLVLLLWPERTLTNVVPLLPTVVTTCALLTLLCSLLHRLLHWLLLQLTSLLLWLPVLTPASTSEQLLQLRGQHHLSPKKKKRKHSLDCPRGA